MQKKIFLISLLFAIFPLLAVAAEHQIKLKNGNIVKGEIQGGSVKFKTDLGDLNMPVDDLMSLTESIIKRKDGGTTREIIVELNDGSSLKGSFIDKSLSLKTRYGVFTIKPDDVKEIAKIQEQAPQSGKTESPVSLSSVPVSAQPVADSKPAPKEVEPLSQAASPPPATVSAFIYTNSSCSAISSPLLQV